MVEIGPGLGAMTLPLLNRMPSFSVIELDRDLAAKLRKRENLDVIESDVLKVDFAALAAAKGQKLRVVGNLPYNISTPILFHLLGFVDHVVDQHFMLQKEVVDRMAASPGCKDYGRLTVMLQWRYAIESVFDVPPEAFDPPPRVMSAIVRMQPFAKPPELDVKLLGEMVAGGLLAASQAAASQPGCVADGAWLQWAFRSAASRRRGACGGICGLGPGLERGLTYRATFTASNKKGTSRSLFVV